MPDEDYEEELPPAEKLKDQGNDLFSSRRYAKAAEKCEAARLPVQSCSLLQAAMAVVIFFGGR